MSSSLFNDIELKSSAVRSMSPLQWAYIGDAVYELHIRTCCLKYSGSYGNALHLLTVSFVNAAGQAQILGALTEVLQDAELDIVRRARNVSSSSVPKNADMQNYRMATALEGLIGYLYLSGAHVRLKELLDIIGDYVKEEIAHGKS